MVNSLFSFRNLLKVMDLTMLKKRGGMKGGR